jgi:uncharacterized membrane protein
MKRLLFRFTPFLAGAVLVGALVHLVVILLVPHVAKHHAGARLALDAAVNTLEVLQPGEQGNDGLAVPFADPSMAMAVCRFDLSSGAVRLRIPVSDNFLSVALLSPTGHVLLSLTDRAATRRVIDMLLVTPEQQKQLEAQDPEDEPVQEIRIRMAHTSGVALVRALALRDVDKTAVTALLGRGICRQE